VKDTQWPLFEVFHQERPDSPHYNIGAVHAPDAEMALLNGRDLYVRRPRCHSLWVAPVEAIYSRTTDELSQDPSWEQDASDPDAPVEAYQVFVKTTQRRAMKYVAHVGQVEAASPEEAMKKAVAKFSDDPPPFVWWVCPERAITRSDPADIESWFAPANDKRYRLPNQYRTVLSMRQIKRRGSESQ
jgi:ring-1,2-phenylacetyl-CoA epoxidase subunit PaaB